MRNKMTVAGCVLLMLTIAAAQSAKPKEQHRSVTQVLDSTVTNLEHEFVPAADAMPEEKFGFAPTNGEFKGVRTFAQQIKQGGHSEVFERLIRLCAQGDCEHQ